MALSTPPFSTKVDDVFEAGISKEFNALHVMPGVEGPEGRLHEHDYRLEVVASRSSLDERGMVCDLDVLESALAKTIAVIAGRDLEMIRPAHVEAVTVEVLARWCHSQLAAALSDTGVERLAVRAWESPVAFGGYEGPLSAV
jgi:6-pyruvoyltetrahydropterin/6-carboxytetrahydropterin synthase